MMDVDPNTIVNALVAILGAGGVYGGGRLAYNKIQAARQASAQMDGGFSNMQNTGQIPALDIVTGSECRATSKGITDSIHEVKTEVKEGMDRQSNQLTKLSESVNKMNEALAGQEARILKAVGYGVREHERRYHGSRSTGSIPK